jgi:hypothetical protein
MDKLAASRLPTRLIAWASMFMLIIAGWMIFRAPGMGWLVNILFHSPWVHGQADWVASLIILSMTAFYSMPMAVKLLLDRTVSPGFVQSFYYALLSAGIVIYLGSTTTDFIYFQF